MVTTSKRKRDAAFKLLAEMGFEWNGKHWAGRLPDEQAVLLTGDKLYEFLVDHAPTEGDSPEVVEHWTAYDLWALETWEKTTDYFGRHREEKSSS